MAATWILIAVTSMAMFLSTEGQDTSSCVYACLNAFTSTADKIMGSSRSGAGSWQNLLHLSNGHRMNSEHDMKKNFDEMCRSFASMKRCVHQCRDVSLRDSVVSGFASIQYVCEDHYQEFITHLPCLAANERRVVERCSRETNQTAAAITALEKTVFQNNIAKMTTTLAALCRNTSQIVDCLKPATEEVCGKQPAAILRRLVTLGFRSIEQMYKRMNIEDQLPRECLHLAYGRNEKIQQAHVPPKSQHVHPSSRTTSPNGQVEGHNIRPTFNDAYLQTESVSVSAVHCVMLQSFWWPVLFFCLLGYCALHT